MTTYISPTKTYGVAVNIIKTNCPVEIGGGRGDGKFEEIPDYARRGVEIKKIRVSASNVESGREILLSIMSVFVLHKN